MDLVFDVSIGRGIVLLFKILSNLQILKLFIHIFIHSTAKTASSTLRSE